MNEQITTITQGNGAANALPLGWLLAPMQAQVPAEEGRLPDFSGLLAALTRQTGTSLDEGGPGQDVVLAEYGSAEGAALQTWLEQLDALLTQLETRLKQAGEQGESGLRLDDATRDAFSEAMSALQAWLQTQTRQHSLHAQSVSETESAIRASTDGSGKNLPPLSAPEADAVSGQLAEEAADAASDPLLPLAQTGGEAAETAISGRKSGNFQARLAAVAQAPGKNGGDPVSTQPEKVAEARELEEAEWSIRGQDDIIGAARLSPDHAGSSLPASLQQVVTHLRQLGERLPAGTDRLRHALAQLEQVLVRQAEGEPMSENIPPAQAQSVLPAMENDAAVGAWLQNTPLPLMARFVAAGGGMRSAPAMATNDAVRMSGPAEPARVTETDMAESGADAATDGEPGVTTGSQRLMQSAVANGDGLPPLRLPLRHPQWGEALAQRVMMLANGNRQLAQIRLHPAHLGPIEVSLKMDGEKGMQVSLHAHHALTREAIEQALPRLRELFDAQGIALADVQVQADGRGHAQTFAEARREMMRSSASGAPGVKEDAPVIEAVRRPVSTALVDHFV